MRLSITRPKAAYSSFCATSTLSGIVVVFFQMLLLYWAFGLRGATLFVLVPLLGTIASAIPVRKTIQKVETEAPRTWRNAVANVGVATILGIATIAGVTPYVRSLFAAMIIASLAAALSDTLSHELGLRFGGTPRLITSFRKVAPGVHGAVSAFGSLVAILTAFAFGGTAAALGLIPSNEILAVALSAIVGNLVDSILGATFERRGWLGNDLVNFACVLSASILVLLLVR
jgi:uncharacterized protein (TIGR00297 family)